MRFLISRNPNRLDDNANVLCPCEGARWIDYLNPETYNISSFEKYDERYNIGVLVKNYVLFTGEGHNHRIVDGKIVRDMMRSDWFIDIDSLDSIMQLIDREGPIKIAPSFFSAPPTIQIKGPGFSE